MSYAYRSSVKLNQKPQRPLGVALIGSIGVLAGLVWAVLMVYLIWGRAGQGNPMAGRGIVLAGGLLAALIVIWLYWGLLDMLRWAWWMNVALAPLAVVALGVLFGSVPELAPMFSPSRLSAAIRQTTFVLYAAMGFGLVFNLIVGVYLLTVRKAFGIGLKDQRPLWERRRL
jgi:hypothetical protein